MIGNHLLTPILAQNETGPGRAVYEFGRLSDFDDVRLPVTLIAVSTAAIVMLVWYLYRRDTRELSPGVGRLLAGLRFVALAGLLIFFLGVERRTTREIVHNSQVAVLVDSSQSMALADNPGGGNNSTKSRTDQVVAALKDLPLLSELREHHDVNVARFDQDVKPVATLPKENPPPFVGEQGDKSKERPVAVTDGAGEGESDSKPAKPKINWSAELEPSGTQTRLGDALADQLYRYRAAPLAGLIVISDGVQNAGTEPSAAVAAAREAGIPVYTIGIGSTEPRRNLGVSDLLVPARAFPGDTVSITGYIQATGYAGQFVDVELLRRTGEEPAGSGTSIATERIQIGADGEVVPVSFDVEPDAPGRFVYQVRAAAPPDDDNPRDNGRESEMDVVDRQTRVLLVASGPTREYRFLRDQLHRDKTMKCDVLLQTGQPGMSQDAENLLDEFPATRDELYQYDCIVAFDPDWRKLDAAQVELLEKWVSDEAGGLIVIPGPIHTNEWVRSVEHAKLRDLYPVTFQQRLTLLDDGHFGGEAAFPIQFERAGRDARFLWLANTADESQLAWSGFPGVFGYYAIKSEKPGATVYARVADPEAGLGDKMPVYMAGQFYGAGQVLYIGSGEFWRLRAIDPAYFEVLYTKLVRQVSQGRLLRGSSRGSLLVDRDRYELGETVVLRGRLADERHEPLALENVTAQVMQPDNTTEAVKLTADAQQPGMYLGQFVVRQEGTYQVALPVPGSDEEPFSKYIQVRVPDLERTHPERNVALLTSIAKDTGGRYYPNLELAAYGDTATMSLGKAIPSRAEVKLLKGAPDKAFAERQMTWLLGVIAGALFMEWIVRRLNRLA
ncbi:MAG: hypothetical protein AB7G28_04500 [Pirellulales bacterium]